MCVFQSPCLIVKTHYFSMEHQQQKGPVDRRRLLGQFHLHRVALDDFDDALGPVTTGDDRGLKTIGKP